jgi:hypothetical protein
MDFMEHNPTKWNRGANCMGWALQIRDWVHMDLHNDVSHDRCAEIFMEQAGLKLVEKKDMVLGKCYIALRVNCHDYHFMRRNESGHWTHKQGRDDVKTISQKKVFGEGWHRSHGESYFGKIWLFEV